MSRKRRYIDYENYENDNYCVRNKNLYPDKYEDEIFKAGDREIHFNTHIDLQTVARIKKLISEIIDDNKNLLFKRVNGKIPQEHKDEPKFIITYIVNSPGGDVHEILNFVDYINHLRKIYFNLRFKSIITGLVASAGTIMCVVADIRQITYFGYAMIHELSAGMARSNYTRIRTSSDRATKLHNDLVKIYLLCRGIGVNDKKKKEELEGLLLRETWMTSQEYKEHGFVDDILEYEFPQSS
jgi:ATP-dependent protease ClpP protease subunit